MHYFTPLSPVLFTKVFGFYVYLADNFKNFYGQLIENN